LTGARRYSLALDLLEAIEAAHGEGSEGLVVVEDIRVEVVERRDLTTVIGEGGLAEVTDEIRGMIGVTREGSKLMT
jgi:hypothetical protein